MEQFITHPCTQVSNRRAHEAVKQTKGLLNQAVSRALEPSFFFATFDQASEECVTGTTHHAAL
jgi:hypothetical protein